jgi:hypothetical protein
MPQLPVRKRENNDPDFEEYLRRHVLHLNAQRKRQEWMVRLWVTLERRYRGITVSDICGFFSPQKHAQHVWTDVEVDPDKPDIHPIPIVKPAIRANTAAMLQADVAINVEARVQDARKENGADIAQKIADYLRSKFWKEAERTLLFDTMQKNGAGFSYFKYTPTEQTFAAPTFNETDKQLIYEYECECGYSGTAAMPASEDAEPITAVQCEQCSAQVPAILQSEQEPDEEFAGFAQEPGIDMSCELLPPFFVTVDTLETQGGKLDKARFVEIARLRARSEIEQDYPQFKFESPTEWGYALKCWYALTNNEFDILYKWDTSEGGSDYDLFEERDIILDPRFYGGYRAPRDWEFRGAEGNVKFAIKKGQTIAEAQKALFKTDSKGFRFIWSGDRLVDIVSPKDQPVKITKTLAVAQFAPNSSSFWGIPFWDIIQTQDDITNLNTILIEHYARNSVTNLMYDSTYWDKDDFANDVIGSKQAIGAQGIQNTYAQLQAPRLDNGISQHLTFLLQTKDESSGVTAPMRGEPQPGEPAAAQRMQLNQANGTLTAPLKSYAEMLCQFTKQGLYHAQAIWPIEKLQAIGAEYGEKWEDADVRDFKDASIEDDFTIEYRTGSEMPQSTLEKEIKFSQLVTQVGGFIPLGAVKPAAITAIIKRLTEFANTDIDLSGDQLDERLATQRFRDILNVCEQSQAPKEHIRLAAQEIVSEDPETGEKITALDVKVAEVLAAAEVEINVKAENHDTHVEFYRNRIKALLMKRETNALLIATLDQLIELHAQAKSEFMQKDRQFAIDAEQPDRALENQANQSAQADAKAQAEAQAQAEAKKTEQDTAERERQRQHEIDMKAIDKTNERAIATTH